MSAYERRMNLKREIADLKAPVPLDHTTLELEQYLDTVKAIPRKEAARVRKIAQKAAKHEVTE